MIPITSSVSLAGPVLLAGSSSRSITIVTYEIVQLSTNFRMGWVFSDQHLVALREWSGDFGSHGG